MRFKVLQTSYFLLSKTFVLRFTRVIIGSSIEMHGHLKKKVIQGGSGVDKSFNWSDMGGGGDGGFFYSLKGFWWSGETSLSFSSVREGGWRVKGMKCIACCITDTTINSTPIDRRLAYRGNVWFQILYLWDCPKWHSTTKGFILIFFFHFIQVYDFPGGGRGGE